MDSLPQEIRKIIFSFLADKDVRVARLANTDWLRSINYSKFRIFFASSALLPQIVERLSKYQYPIELELLKPFKYTKSEFLEHISRLTQLRSLELWDYSHHEQDVLEAEEYLKLSTLTNLEVLTLDFGDDEFLPIQLLQFLPRLKRGISFDHTPKFFELATLFSDLYCTNADLPYLPIAVTELRLELTDQPLDELTRLTKLKKLNFFGAERPLDLRHITWLEYLDCQTYDVVGLENSRHLTKLSIRPLNSHKSAAMVFNSVVELPFLRKIRMSLCVNIGMSNFSRLTSLAIYAGQGCDTTSLIATLPLSLQELFISSDSEIIDISNLSHLVRLTTLGADRCTSTAKEPLINLTNLRALRIGFESHQEVSFQILTNLTSLGITDEQFNIPIQSLKNLQRLAFKYSGVDITTWKSLQYLKHLTSSYFTDSFPQSSPDLYDFKALAKLPLRILEPLQDTSMNFWTVIPSLTTIEDLSLSTNVITTDDDILLLTALDKLTALRINAQADSVTFIHLTNLTSLQDISFYFEPNTEDLTLSQLSVKLTRLLRCPVYG